MKDCRLPASDEMGQSRRPDRRRRPAGECFWTVPERQLKISLPESRPAAAWPTFPFLSEHIARLSTPAPPQAMMKVDLLWLMTVLFTVLIGAQPAKADAGAFFLAVPPRPPPRPSTVCLKL